MMSRFEIAVLFLVIGIIIGWIVGVIFFTSTPIEDDMPHFIPEDQSQERD